MLGKAAVLLSLSLAGCTHVMASVDTDGLSDSQTLEASAYGDLADAGACVPPRTQTKVKDAYCSTHGVLARSGAAQDAGIACPQ